MKVSVTSISIAKKKKANKIAPKALQGLKTKTRAKTQSTTPEKKKTIVLTVNRKKWITGELADTEGNMCIMGQYLHKVGNIPLGRLEGMGSTHKFTKQLKGTSLAWTVPASHTVEDGEYDEYGGYEYDVDRAVDINDNGHIYGSRESELKEIFAKHGVTLRFVGKG